MVFAVALGAIAVGFLLILLVASHAPPIERDRGMPGAAGPEVPAEEFSEAVRELVQSLGLEIVFGSVGTGGPVELTLRDPKPMVEGRILLHATPATRRGPVDAAEVLSFADAVRGTKGTLKGIFIAAAGFTREARSVASASAARIDLYDGPEFLELLRQHVPRRADEIGRYEGFARGE